MKKIFLIFILNLYGIVHGKTANFKPYSQLLAFHLHDMSSKEKYETAFDYQGAFNVSKPLVKKQLEILDEFKISFLKTKEEALSFWINTYNFFMISKILKDGFSKNKLYISSVKDLALFNRAFKHKNFKVGGEFYSLDYIEKSILLGKDYKKKKWKDARIHFALNCASVGCPPLRKDIYQAKIMDQQLHDNTQKSLNTKRHFHIKNDTLYISYLFRWYESDFLDEAPSLKAWLKTYVGKHKILSSKIKFIFYDWKLNVSSNFK